MGKFLLVGAFCLSSVLTACSGEPSDDKPPTATTTASSTSVSVEVKLKDTLDRSGLDAKNVSFDASLEVLTFTVGTCSGGVNKFGIRVFRGSQDQMPFVSVPFAGDNKGVLDTAQMKTVTENCS